MKLKFLMIGIVALVLSCASIVLATQSEIKPGSIDAVEMTLLATVEAVDHENRNVTLKDTQGNLVTIDVDNQVKNLPQVDIGDTVEVKYIEVVAIQVFAAGQAKPGTSTIAAAKGAETGEKPAVVAMKEATVVVTIEALDKEHETVTLKDSHGESKTVKVRNPANLDKVVIGDKVMITHTQAIGVSVTEK